MRLAYPTFSGMDAFSDTIVPRDSTQRAVGSRQERDLHSGGARCHLQRRAFGHRLRPPSSQTMLSMLPRTALAVTLLVAPLHAQSPASLELIGPGGATRTVTAAAVAELDAGFTDRVVLITDTKDGASLSAKDGPFQLIVPDEKRPARWVRQVRRIRVVQLPPPGA